MPADITITITIISAGAIVIGIASAGAIVIGIASAPAITTTIASVIAMKPERCFTTVVRLVLILRPLTTD